MDNETAEGLRVGLLVAIVAGLFWLAGAYLSQCTCSSAELLKKGNALWCRE